MKTVQVHGAEIEYEEAGDGPSVLFIHGGVVPDMPMPLLKEPALGDFRLIHYRRRGYGGSKAAPPPSTVEGHVLDAQALIEILGAAPAHIVGHSYGALVGIDLAIRAPELVRTLVFLEAGVVPYIKGVERMDFTNALESYASGAKAAAIDSLLKPIFDDNYRVQIAAALGDGFFDMAVADIDTVFQAEFPSNMAWKFDAERAALVRSPILNVVGAESDALGMRWHGIPLAAANAEVISTWWPNATFVVLPNVNHGMLVQDPRLVAETLAAFLSRHPGTTQ